MCLCECGTADTGVHCWWGGKWEPPFWKTECCYLVSWKIYIYIYIYTHTHTHHTTQLFHVRLILWRYVFMCRRIHIHVCILSCFSCVWLCVTLWTIAWQAPLSWDFPGMNSGVVVLPSSRGSSPHRDRTSISFVSCTGKRVLYH